MYKTAHNGCRGGSIPLVSTSNIKKYKKKG